MKAIAQLPFAPRIAIAPGAPQAPRIAPAIASIKTRVSDAAADWLDPIPFQVFATLMFPFRPSAESAAKRYAGLISDIERTIKTPVSHIFAAEIRSKTGLPVQRHFHSAMAATKPIPCELVSQLWADSFGNSHASAKDTAVVTPYDSTRRGVHYITKQVTDPSCEYDTGNVGQFVFDPFAPVKTGRRARRAERRHPFAGTVLAGAIEAAA